MNYYADKIKNKFKKQYHKYIEYKKRHLNKHLTFKEIDFNTQFFHYQSSLENRPLVVLFHEWNWGFKRYNALSKYCVENDINYMQPKFRDYNFGMNGYLSRLAIEDIEKQIQYFIDNSRTISDINLVGFSGGGYMALKYNHLSKFSIKNTIALSPITDIESWYHYLKKENIIYYHDILKFVTGDLHKLHEMNSNISPSHYDKIKDNRIVIIHGKDDRIVPFEQSKLYFDNMANRELNLRKIDIDIDSTIARKIDGLDIEDNLEFYSHSGNHEDDSFLTFYLLRKYV